MSNNKKDDKNKTNNIGDFNLQNVFARLNKLTTRDLNNNISTPTFSLYSKEDIQTYLTNPYRYEKQLRQACVYIYGASAQFRRIIQYFVGLTDLAYLVEPYNIDPKKANAKTVNSNYRKTLNMLSSMNIKTQIPKILTVCLREDVYYGTLWVTNDSITIQQLPSDYCAISTIEGNVFNVTFDFSYFDSRSALLEYYPQEFKVKYEQYQKNRTTKWIELDSPTSFCIKCNNDITDYALPPFAGLLRELYDLEDYKQLKLTKTQLENYAMLVMMLPMDNNGDWAIDLDKAKDFWRNLDSVLPEEIGTILTPMPIEKIDFEKSNTGDTDTITNAEQHMFTSAGVSSLLFNNEKASAGSLTLSIKADQMITYSLVKSIGDMINRFLQSQSYGKNFIVNFLDTSTYNRKEMGDAYLKAATYGLPTISAYAASQGIGQAELDTMSYLETSVLNLQDMFVAVNTKKDSTNEGGAIIDEQRGRPKLDIDEKSDQRELNEESE